jgi:hypothetical protein
MSSLVMNPKSALFLIYGPEVLSACARTSFSMAIVARREMSGSPSACAAPAAAPPRLSVDYNGESGFSIAPQSPAEPSP